MAVLLVEMLVKLKAVEWAERMEELWVDYLELQLVE
jgi:hypothetical protein